MHIEPGVLSQAKIVFATAAATGLFAAYLPKLLRSPTMCLRAVLAAVFFTIFMQSMHMQVGPSELHFIGAMPIYLMFGLVPTLFGFALGLLVQGLVFEPQDLAHLSVNALSLAVPLLLTHYSLGKRMVQTKLVDILKLDASYYGGVTLMVAFWLSMGKVATPFLAWLQFASSYLAVIALEPVVTLGLLWLHQRYGNKPWVATCFAVRKTA